MRRGYSLYSGFSGKSGKRLAGGGFDDTGTRRNHLLRRDVDRDMLLLLGGETQMTRESKAIELLHRVMGYYLGDFTGADEIGELLNEIGVFLTETEAKEKGL